jgi:pantoate--beta-alanine ligase
MITVTSIKELGEIIKQVKKEATVGFVPTMGYLHEGHMSLVKKAKETTDFVVMSIFVNPTQFGPNEDFEKYPRDLARDEKMAREGGVDVLFAPPVEEMYPKPGKTTVHVSGITEQLCGASRPGHFDGVALVVSKLFNIVQPDYAFFGLKDAQQVAVIEQMVQDLNFPVKIVPCEIVREADGLALSSRNVYLSPEERKEALILYQSLKHVKERFNQGERDAEVLRQEAVDMIQTSPLAQIDYVSVLSYPELENIKKIEKTAIVALAVRFGKTRLIDNILLS